MLHRWLFILFMQVVKSCFSQLTEQLSIVIVEAPIDPQWKNIILIMLGCLKLILNIDFEFPILDESECAGIEYPRRVFLLVVA